jgi:LuxR family maltose regulon positive regulatory protein
LRLVACARTRTAAGLSRVRVDGDLVELGPGDLAFTPEEADDLLRLNGVALPPDVLASLVDRMDGWATGLCLAAREAMLAADPVSTVDAFDADRPTTVDYFRSEVMAALDLDDRNLLLRASVAPAITPALADAILESTRGARALDRLNRAHLVECVDGAHYRIPPVLLRYLRHEAQLEVPAAIRERDQRLAEDNCPKATVHTGLIEPISGREAVVLALLPSLLNAREIAAEFTVSVNTVKSHIRSIYAKLGVSSRREAVRVAQERGLLR